MNASAPRLTRPLNYRSTDADESNVADQGNAGARGVKNWLVKEVAGGLAGCADGLFPSAADQTQAVEAELKVLA